MEQKKSHNKKEINNIKSNNNNQKEINKKMMQCTHLQELIINLLLLSYYKCHS
jgi:hypothetical protein